jgi:hypothetical protein
VRDQFIRLSRWGVTVDAGIILDEASIDFFSAHTADLLLADHYTRDPLLYSGFNRGQGIKAMYSRWGLTLGLAYTEGNPLSTSTSFQVGGTFGGNSRFWQRPLSGFQIGQPDDSFHFRLVSPSLTFAQRWGSQRFHVGIEAKTMAQYFWVDYDTDHQDAPKLHGYNVRGNLRLSVGGRAGRVPWAVTPFGNVAYESNEVLNATAGMTSMLLNTWYQALSWSAGCDLLLFGRSGIGISYAQVAFDSPSYVAAMGNAPVMEPVTHTTQGYLNIGLTYWMTEYVALGTRVATYTKTESDDQGHAKPDEKALAFFATLRLIL